MLPEKSGLVQATLCRGSTSKHLSNRRESTLGSPLRENRTAGFAWGFGHKGEILRPNSTSQNIIFIGKPGTGKTGLAISFV